MAESGCSAVKLHSAVACHPHTKETICTQMYIAYTNTKMILRVRRKLNETTPKHVRWDSALGAIGRMPFVVPASAPWADVSKGLEHFFSQIVSSEYPLTSDHLRYLRTKVGQTNPAAGRAPTVDASYALKQPIIEFGYYFANLFTGSGLSSTDSIDVSYQAIIKDNMPGRQFTFVGITTLHSPPLILHRCFGYKHFFFLVHVCSIDDKRGFAYACKKTAPPRDPAGTSSWFSAHLLANRAFFLVGVVLRHLRSCSEASNGTVARWLCCRLR